MPRLSQPRQRPWRVGLTVLLACASGGWLFQAAPVRAASAITSTPTTWENQLYSNPFDAFYRTPFSAAPTGSEVTLRLVGPASLRSAAIQLSNVNGQSNQTATLAMHRVSAASLKRIAVPPRALKQAVWQGVIPAKDLRVPGILNYDFKVADGSQVVYYANATSGFGGPGAVYPNPFALVYYQITVYNRSFTTPAWLRHGIIYEIMPDRFYDGNPANNENPKTQLAVGFSASGQEQLVPIQFHSNWYSTPYDPNIVANPTSPNYAKELALRGDGQWNTDFFGGDLRGIIDKLGYLKKLGVNTLYLTPIFQSESNHKYDTGNYMKIDPGFGTLKTFQTLVKEAKSRGMHVILDGVFEDTGSDSLYFNQFGNYKSVGAWQEHLNPKVHSPYYHWFLWTPGQNPPYQTWGGVATLPLANTASKGWQQFVYGKYDKKNPLNPAKNSVAAYWLSQGASGWRLDSADNSNFSLKWWSNFRRAVKRVNPNAAIIGEDWNNPTNDNGVDWMTGNTWDSTMNYPFRNAMISFFRGTYYDGNVQNYAINAQTFGNTLMQMLQEYPPPAMYAEMNLLGSQDTERILTILSGAPNANALSAFQQATWKPTPAQAARGMAKLEEVSAFQYGFVGVPDIYYGDEAGMNGYTDPLNRATYPWGRANQTLVHYFQRLGAIRNSHTVLQSGGYRQLLAEGKVFAYARTPKAGEGGQTAVVAVNNGAATSIRIPVATVMANGTILANSLGGVGEVTVRQGHIRLRLAKYGAAILFTKARG